eukprot:TRINITY_DN8304_c0_g1_i5.p1 TRINITY_DN8304_c0_g1~~TRINITY_DN8304_c0_g1_i5.p1  ORF type:complete len:394 (-),score=93.03 TRINITY_DN8304_c0_g1_i5:95-1276(-)
MDTSVITNLDIQEYLSRRVEPLLIKGLKELAEKKPQNPLEYLAQYLIRNNTEFDEPQEQLQLKQENKPKFKMHEEKEEEQQQLSEQEEDEFSEEQENELKNKQLQAKEKGVRSGVSAEVFGEHNRREDFIPQVIQKTEEQKGRISQRLSQAFMFSGLDEKEKETVINAMEEKQFKAGEVVIQQGDDGNNLFVIDQGELECFKKYQNQEEEKFQKNYHPGESFGELALLYNTPRAATVKCVSNCVLFALDRDCFIHIVKDATVRKRLKYEELLASIEILKEMDPYDRSYLTDALVPKIVKQGDLIYKEGETVGTFYFIEDGQVAITQNEKKILDLKEKDYFGELEVLTNSATRSVTATAQTECKLLGLESNQFQWLLFKPLEDLFRVAKVRYNQ